MVGWHHQLNGHEFEQTLEDSAGQGSLVGCRLWGHTESDTTKRRSSSSSGSSFVKPVESDGNSGWRQNRIVGHSIGVWRL